MLNTTTQEIEKLSHLFPSLTLKQFSILHMFALGMNIKNIAKNTNTSSQNIKNHLKSIRIKLECACSQELRLIYTTKLLTSIHLK
ncbi:hypothetical protein F0250_23040 [Vibrio cyclitrophicus]|uniref:helix-turn-helix transcriptional regulator n=1 Tax=Vibrio cyclitrophicus TaxID=47951 RepID=UPI00148D8C00|nr:hypothetical protein [Vibrio cyclitrophicus]